MKETATGFETYFRQYLKRGISGGRTMESLGL